jgi:hypothetical protein
LLELCGSTGRNTATGCRMNFRRPRQRVGVAQARRKPRIADGRAVRRARPLTRDALGDDFRELHRTLG